ncbi:MAG: hypothetical protein ABH879_11095 [archaeon]
MQKINNWWWNYRVGRIIKAAVATIPAVPLGAGALEEVIEPNPIVQEQPAKGTLDFYANRTDSGTTPYLEFWLMKSYGTGNLELYAETMAQGRDLNGAYIELLGYYDPGRAGGFAVWAEGVMNSEQPESARAGFMYSGSPFGLKYLMLRSGCDTNGDPSLRMVFNASAESFPGMNPIPGDVSVGGLVNKNNLTDGGWHIELPRIDVSLKGPVSLNGEVTADRNMTQEGSYDTSVGVRGGLRLGF